jgi:hypothetical protein
VRESRAAAELVTQRGFDVAMRQHGNEDNRREHCGARRYRHPKVGRQENLVSVIEEPEDRGLEDVDPRAARRMIAREGATSALLDSRSLDIASSLSAGAQDHPLGAYVWPPETWRTSALRLIRPSARESDGSIPLALTKSDSIEARVDRA